MDRFNICSPIGGFGNHVRWLVLLDPQYSFLINSGFLTQEAYQFQKGSEWPDYTEYLNLNFINCSENVKAEILHAKSDSDTYPEILKFDTQFSKIKAFENQIYPEFRTWHNWLTMELKFRYHLDDFLTFRHNYSDLPDPAMIQKTLILTTDPDLAYRCYVKFNIILNFKSPGYFKKQIQLTNLNNSLINEENIKICCSDVLFNHTLDKNFYNELVDWFGLSDLYNEANYIHGLWFAGQQRAEQDIVTDLTKLYGANI
jgi:hypothetical protein